MSHSLLIQSVPISLLQKDKRKKINYKFLDFFWNILPLLPKSVCLAGGSLRVFFNKKEQVKDFDLFFIAPDQDQIDKDFETTRNFFWENDRFYQVFRCPENKLFTFRDKLTDLKVQIIKEDLKSTPESLLNNFDFNAARFAIFQDKFYFSRASVKDVKSKVLSLFNLI